MKAAIYLWVLVPSYFVSSRAMILPREYGSNEPQVDVDIPLVQQEKTSTRLKGWDIASLENKKQDKDGKRLARRLIQVSVPDDNRQPDSPFWGDKSFAKRNDDERERFSKEVDRQRGQRAQAQGNYKSDRNVDRHNMSQEKRDPSAYNDKPETQTEEEPNGVYQVGMPSFSSSKLQDGNHDMDYPPALFDTAAESASGVEMGRFSAADRYSADEPKNPKTKGTRYEEQQGADLIGPSVYAAGPTGYTRERNERKDELSSSKGSSGTMKTAYNERKAPARDFQSDAFGDSTNDASARGSADQKSHSSPSPDSPFPSGERLTTGQKSHANTQENLERRKKKWSQNRKSSLDTNSDRRQANRNYYPAQRAEQARRQSSARNGYPMSELDKPADSEYEGHGINAMEQEREARIAAKAAYVVSGINTASEVVNNARPAWTELSTAFGSTTGFFGKLFTKNKKNRTQTKAAVKAS